RNVGSSGRTGSVTAPVHLVVQVLQLLFEVLSVGLPRHAVDTRRGVLFERKVALLQETGKPTAVSMVSRCKMPPCKRAWVRYRTEPRKIWYRRTTRSSWRGIACARRRSDRKKASNPPPSILSVIACARPLLSYPSEYRSIRPKAMPSRRRRAWPTPRFK